MSKFISKEEKITQRLGGKTFQMVPPYFPEYLIPAGFLSTEKECHALFYYNLLARNAYDRVKTGVELEGETTLHANYDQLFKSVARMYGIRPEQMLQHWKAVDMQCMLLDIPSIPDEVRYRFNGLVIVK